MEAAAAAAQNSVKQSLHVCFYKAHVYHHSADARTASANLMMYICLVKTEALILCWVRHHHLQSLPSHGSNVYCQAHNTYQDDRPDQLPSIFLRPLPQKRPLAPKSAAHAPSPPSKADINTHQYTISHTEADIQNLAASSCSHEPLRGSNSPKVSGPYIQTSTWNESHLTAWALDHEGRELSLMMVGLCLSLALVVRRVGSGSVACSYRQTDKQTNNQARHQFWTPPGITRMHHGMDCDAAPSKADPEETQQPAAISDPLRA